MLNTGKANKNLAIETLRGVAIILMVSGHVIGAKATDGLKVADNSSWRFFYYAFEYIRMPLFTVMSGYIYAYKPVYKFPSNGKFILGKINRLLIPLIVVSTLFYLIQHFSPGTNAKTNLADIRFIYLYPYAHFWFLQGMLIVFLIIVILENFNLLKSFKYAMLCLVISALIYILLPYKFNNFSINKVPFLLTFFTLGLILKRFYDTVFKTGTVYVAVVIFICCYTYQLYLFNIADNVRINSLLAFLVGSSACILLIRLNWTNKKLIWLGGFSYGIYLFHILGAVASRVIMNKLHINNMVIQVSCGVAAGVLFPVALQLVLGRFKLLSTLLFGEKLKFGKPVISAKENDKLIHQEPSSGSAVV
ncbi:acyltransferase [Mucilaginibacter pallidiroseus]|uniref:Acyltransferase n=1 Tax=Mucilaginibacter pallidiroseus TaxID=2599295 RepID=A0A563UHN9_9SPHI|nr:acyltransferase [Mucilaginibacter pallidiroseus]TWR30910.1 acyltransferase [Mucilaginibacter pallidiroseus]